MSAFRRLSLFLWRVEAAHCLVRRYSFAWKEAWAYASRDLAPTYFHDGYGPVEAVEVDREYWVEFK